MSIRITCPGCETSLTLGDDKRGKKVRCKSCEKVLSIPSANGKARTKQADPDEDEDEDEDEEETEDQEAEEEPKKKTKSAADEKSETKKDGKARKKKKKKGGGIEVPWFWIGLGAVALLILLIPGGIVMLWRPWEEPERKAAQNNPPGPQMQMPMQPPPGNNPIGGNVVKEPKSLLGNLRARGDRAERDNEMKNIGLFFQQYHDTVTNPNARTLDGYLAFMKKDSPKLHDSLKEEKYYTLNLKAKLGSTDILVYETEQYTTGYYVLRANNEMGFVTPQELKAGLP